MKTENSILTYLALTAAVFFWGLSFVATKIALQSFTPFCLIFFRFFSASIFFTILLWRTGSPSLTEKTLTSVQMSGGALVIVAVLLTNHTPKILAIPEMAR
jgi:drug/metabolite transporter (DMT)-like permease